MLAAIAWDTYGATKDLIQQLADKEQAPTELIYLSISVCLSIYITYMRG